MQGKRARITSVFKRNWLLKLLALGLATVSFLAIQRITNQLEEFEIPISVQVEKGVAVLRQDARTAYITCRGSREDLNRLDPEQLHVVVAPRVAGRVGTEQVPIGPKNVSGPMRGISIMNVRPGIVNLTFDLEIQKNVSIARPELVGKPLVGKAEVDYEPKIASVRGPRQQLADLKILRTGPIDIDGAVDSSVHRLRILTDAQAGVWEVTPSEIVARVSIATEAISREWEAITVLALNSAGTKLDFAFEPDTVDISVHGSLQAVQRIAIDQIRVFVDCDDIKQPGTHSMPVSVYMEEGVDVNTAITPPVVDVTATRRRVVAPAASAPEPEGQPAPTNVPPEDTTEPQQR